MKSPPRNTEQWKETVAEQLQQNSSEIFSVLIEEGIEVEAYNQTHPQHSSATFISHPEFIGPVQFYNKWYDAAMGRLEDFLPSNRTEGIVLCATLHEVLNAENTMKDNQFTYWVNLFDSFETQENGELNLENEKNIWDSLSENICQKTYFIIDIATHQNAGAQYSFQIALALAKLNELITYFSPSLLNRCIVKVAVGENYLVEISKLRALHWVLSSFYKEFGKDEFEIPLYSIPTEINITTIDPENNLIRSTLEITASILGGSRYIGLVPFTQKENPEWVYETAMKQALILSHESLLNYFNDALSGSYNVEALTLALAEKAWEKFQKIEQNEGYSKQFEEICKEINLQLQDYIHSINSTSQKIIGYNLYETHPFAPIDWSFSTTYLKPFKLP